jgi:hypothetical protein
MCLLRPRLRLAIIHIWKIYFVAFYFGAVFIEPAVFVAFNKLRFYWQDDEEIQSILAGHFVSRVYTMIEKMDGRTFPFRTVFMTLEIPVFSTIIKFGHERLSVQPCIPNLMPYVYWEIWTYLATMCIHAASQSQVVRGVSLQRQHLPLDWPIWYSNYLYFPSSLAIVRHILKESVLADERGRTDLRPMYLFCCGVTWNTWCTITGHEPSLHWRTRPRRVHSNMVTFAF